MLKLIKCFEESIGAQTKKKNVKEYIFLLVFILCFLPSLKVQKNDCFQVTEQQKIKECIVLLKFYQFLQKLIFAAAFLKEIKRYTLILQNPRMHKFYSCSNSTCGPQTLQKLLYYLFQTIAISLKDIAQFDLSYECPQVFLFIFTNHQMRLVLYYYFSSTGIFFQGHKFGTKR